MAYSGDSGRPAAPSRAYAPILWTCLVLFAVRVAGQLLVATRDVPFLPPMDHWYSGLLPYPILLPAQVFILGLMIAICIAFTQGRGALVEPRPRLGRALRAVAGVYAGAMAVRYGVTMALHPERRWLGPGTIPVVFHWVLAAFLYTVARYQLRRPSP